MKNLLKKEIKLASSPLSWFFIAFSVMALIPNYPILLSAFFVCFGVFHSFQNARENNDLLFTVLLPVSKADAVRAKFAFTVLIQALAFVGSIVFSIVRMVCLKNIPPFDAPAMMTANQIYLIWILVVYTVFNFVFVVRFFKTGWKLGMPFLAFGISSFVVITLAETLHHIPGLKWLNTVAAVSNGALWAAVAAAVVLWLLGAKLAMNKAIRYFEALDL